jgi:hypothetical protein
MGEHIDQQAVRRQSTAWKRPSKQAAEAIARRLMEIVVYDQGCRIGARLSLNDLAETDVGDWSMPDFKAASAYAASQGWLVISNDGLTLTTAGLRAA